MKIEQEPVVKFNDIFTALSNINVNEWTDEKGGYTYLKWTSAWELLVGRYPNTTYRFHKIEFFPDESAMVSCTLTVESCSQYMWLPVLDFRNKAIKNPNAFDINTAQMRCLVKSMAMFGLGHYIYAGENVPVNSGDISPGGSASCSPVNDDDVASHNNSPGNPLNGILTPDQIDEVRNPIAVQDRMVICGPNANKKNYGELYTTLIVVQQQLGYWKSHAKTEDQLVHLKNLQALKEHMAIEVRGVTK